MLASGEEVNEVPGSLTHRERRRRPSHGKSDPIDAVAIARVVATEPDLPSPHRNDVLQDLKALCDYREQLVRARTQVANRIHRELLILRPGYAASVPNLTAKGHLSRAMSLL